MLGLLFFLCVCGGGDDHFVMSHLVRTLEFLCIFLSLALLSVATPVSSLGSNRFSSPHLG